MVLRVRRKGCRKQSSSSNDEGSRRNRKQDHYTDSIQPLTKTGHHLFMGTLENRHSIPTENTSVRNYGLHWVLCRGNDCHVLQPTRFASLLVGTLSVDLMTSLPLRGVNIRFTVGESGPREGGSRAGNEQLLIASTSRGENPGQAPTRTDTRNSDTTIFVFELEDHRWLEGRERT